MLWCWLAWTFDGPKILGNICSKQLKAAPTLNLVAYVPHFPLMLWTLPCWDRPCASFAQVWFISWIIFVAPETLAMTVYHQLWFLLLQCLYLPCLCRFQFASPLCQQLWQVHHRPRASNSPSLQEAVHRSYVGCTRVHPQNLTSHLHF